MSQIMLLGKVKYDDKHDSYFIQTANKDWYSCHTMNQKVMELLLGQQVYFQSTEVKEVTKLEAAAFLTALMRF